MDNKECWRSGITNACCASVDNVGCSWMVVLWLEVMLEPSGSWTWMVVSGCVVVDGADDCRKWCEQPLSSMAEWGMMFGVRGGLSVDDVFGGNI